MRVIDVRGTNGSGKTTVVKRVMAALGGAEAATRAYPPFGGKGCTVLRSPNGPAVIIGEYREDRATGGCDGMSGTDEVRECVVAAMCDALIPRVGTPAVILYEGLLPSGIYQAFLDFSRGPVREMTGHGTLWLFLNTPIEECVRRVRQRRLDRGSSPEWKVETLYNKARSVQSVYGKLSNLNTEDFASVSIEAAVKTILVECGHPGTA